MANFKYETVYATRKATESHIEAINGIISAIAESDMEYTKAMSAMNHLRTFQHHLEHDRNYFKAIDAAMEQAVK